MKNFIQKGTSLEYPNAGGAIASGDAIDLGTSLVVATTDIASGDTGSVLTEGVVELPKNNTEAFAFGEKLYWNAGQLSTTDAGSDTVAGFASEDALAAATVGRVKLSPQF